MSEKEMESKVLKSPFWNRKAHGKSYRYWHYKYGPQPLEKAYELQLKELGIK